MSRLRAACASSRCTWVWAFAASVLSTTVSGSATPGSSSDLEGELEEALRGGDECPPSGVLGGQGGPPSCALSALQLRGARQGQAAGADSIGASTGEGGGSIGVFESAPALEGSWSNEGRCSGEMPHELLFVMTPKDADRLERMAMDRTDPGSPNFRKWLSREGVVELVRNEVGLQALRTFLTGHEDLLSLRETRGGEVVRATAPVALWERLLRAEFSIRRHRGTGRQLVRAPSYALPQTLSAHVAGILKVVELGEPLLHAQRSNEVRTEINSPFAAMEQSCSPEARALVCDSFEELKAANPEVVSPPLLRSFYKMPPVARNGSLEAAQREVTSQMVYASLEQHWSPADRAKFVSAFSLTPARKVKELDLGDAMSSNAACRESPGSCAESNLDVQYMTAMSPWSHMGYFYMPKNTTFYEFLYRFITDTSEMRNIPHVISISYGMPEAGATQTAQRAFDVTAKALTLQGITLLAASGDDGAAGTLDRNEQMWPCWLTQRYGLQVSWPASSPWVTAVGATMGAASSNREVVCSVNASGPAAEATRRRPALITSGGGFSMRLARPPWQAGHHAKPSRGVPDVSLAGHAYAIVLGGKWLTVDGTSASSPTLGGMVSLINAQRISAGLNRVGFLNPVLYAHPEVLNDVREGDNRCGSLGTPCCGGYEAGIGWDPTTGLGSVDFSKLAAVLSEGGK